VFRLFSRYLEAIWMEIPCRDLPFLIDNKELKTKHVSFLIYLEITL